MKSPEERLRDSEALYHSLVENLVQSVFRKDLEGRFTFANQRCCQDLGKPLEEILGKTDYDVVLPELAEKYQEDDRRVIETRDHFETVEEHQTRNGKKLYVQVVKTPLYDANGEVIGVQGIYWDITARKEAEAALSAEQHKNERLLLNILPRAIAERLKQGENTIADHFSDLSILFADLVDFTALSARVSHLELIDLLNQIFTTFDRLAEQRGLEKIKTIGDAYMAVSGLPEPKAHHTEATAEMALDMREALEQLNAEKGSRFKMRIGINTGPVIAGIIGRSKFSYDLWGETVNLASRMESHAPAGGIQIAPAAYARLKGKYLIEERGFIQVKGKGDIKTYLLVGRKE